MLKLDTGKYFQVMKPEEGIEFGAPLSWNTDYAVISNVEPGVAVDMDGNEEQGFIFDARPATEKEVEVWMEERRKARGGRSVWDLVDDYASDN